MVDDGDRLPGGGRDLVVPTLKIDGLVVVDSAGAAHGELQIKQA